VPGARLEFQEPNFQDSNLELPAKLPATSASLGFLRGAGEWPSLAIVALNACCVLIEESSMMRAKVRVRSRTQN